MKKLFTVLILILFCFTVFISKGQDVKEDSEQKIFVYGGQINKAFIKYVIGLTEKANPKICFLPTASADNANYIIYWYGLCHDLDMEPTCNECIVRNLLSEKDFRRNIIKYGCPYSWRW